MKFKKVLSAVAAAAIGISMFAGMSFTANAEAAAKYAEWDLRGAKNASVGEDSPTRITGEEGTGSIITMGYADSGISSTNSDKPALYYKRPSSKLSSYSLYRGTIPTDFTTYSGTTVEFGGTTAGYGYKGSKGYGYTYIVDPKLADNDATSYDLKIVFHSNSTYDEKKPEADLRCSLKVVQLDSLAHGKVADGTAETITDEKLADTDENKTTAEVISANSSDLKVCTVKDLTKPSSFGFNIGQPSIVYVGIEYKKSTTPEIKLDEVAEVNQGATIKLEAKIKNADGAKVQWSTENSGCVSVADDGTVTGLKEGTEKVTATIDVNGKSYSASCNVVVRGVATIRYAADGIEGTAPAEVRVAKGSTITLPKNQTMYIEGKTLKGWSDERGRFYAPGTAYIASEPQILSAVFTNNTVSLGDADTTVKYILTKDAGAVDIAYEGNKGFIVAQANIKDTVVDVKMDIDTTVGKFNNANPSWIQINPGAKLTLPVLAGAKVSVEGMNPQFTVGGKAYTGSEAVDLTGDIVITGGTWYKSITVTYPKVEAPVVPTAPEVTVTKDSEYTEPGSNPAALYLGKYTAKDEYPVKTVNWTVKEVYGNDYTAATDVTAVSGGADVTVGLVVTAADLGVITGVSAVAE